MIHKASLVATTLLATAGLAHAADMPAEPVSTSYTYFAIEGGYIHFDAEDVQAFLTSDIPDFNTLHPKFIDLSHGLYGRLEFGHQWAAGPDTGIVHGFGAYLYGWRGDADFHETDFAHGLVLQTDNSTDYGLVSCTSDNEPCSIAKSKLERSLAEAGLRFFHDFGSGPETGGVALGIEPFVALIEEDAKSSIGNDDIFFATRSSDLDARALGALLALDARHFIGAQTLLTARAAAGAYHMDADADTELFSEDDLSSDFVGFRGQLALGLEQGITNAVSFGVIGRLDYWSDFPSIDWTNTIPNVSTGHDDAIANEDFLSLSIGARLTIKLGE